MMRKNWMKIGSAIAGLLVVSAVAQAAVTLTVQRSISGDGTYPPYGGSVDVSLTFTASGDGALLSLGLSETVPTGWAYAGMIEAPAGTLFIQPGSGQLGQLDFVWLTPPEYPIDFPNTLTYRLTVPSGQSGEQQISGEGSYNGGTGNDTVWGPLVTAVPEGPDMVTVPDVTGLTQANAEAALSSVGLVLGTETLEYSTVVPEGSVISQDPAAGTELLEGSSIDLVLSRGPCLQSAPDVVGHTQAVAEAAIVSVGLTVGVVSQSYSDSVPVGYVISQVPGAGTPALCGSAISLVISAGTSTVVVPNVVGQAQATAMTALTNARLVVGTVTQTYSTTVQAGHVISQSPSAGAIVTPGTSVSLDVSRGPCLQEVPNVVGASQASAQATLQISDFVIGTLLSDYSDTVPVGNVVSQSPAGGSVVSCGMAVDLVLSLGPCMTNVPSVVGWQQSAATVALESASLAVGEVTLEYSTTVPSGQVLSQSLAGGIRVHCDSLVSLVVSRGACEAEVPNIVGSSQGGASAILVAAGLTAGTVTEQYSDTVLAGRVISTSPASGTLVACGSPVDFVVSLGPCMVIVPNVAGQTQAAASAALVSADLQVGGVTQSYSETVAAGLIISQDPVSGTSVPCGSDVDLVVSRGACRVATPSVVGQTQAAALTALSGVGLEPGVVTQDYSETVEAGRIISQDPVATAEVPCGSSVDLVLSLGPCRVTAPNVVGETRDAALAALADAGLSLGGESQASSDTVAAGNVMGQNPAAGTQVPCESSISIVLSTGPCQVDVPNVKGKTQSAAVVALGTAGLSTGTVTSEYSDEFSAGVVIGQSPEAGSAVACDTPVDLVISLGPCLVTTPDVVGQLESDATASLATVGLMVGVVTEEYSSVLAEGRVLSQSPAANATAPCEGSVNLVISLGPCLEAVPAVTGMEQQQAAAALEDAGFSLGAVTTEVSETVPLGAIISQDPGAGLRVLCGSSVAIVVSRGPCMMTVPSLAGLTYLEVQTALSDVGLVAGVTTTRCDNTVENGRAVDQDPAAAATVHCGTAVAVVLSSGLCPVPVPNVVGLTRTSAEAAVVEALLTVGTVSAEYSATVPLNVVIRQTPVAGTEAAQGSAVNLVVSNGPRPVTVPDVVGTTQFMAEVSISAVGLVVGQITEQCSDTVAAGTVLTQDPASGGQAVPGSAVNLVVSSGICPLPVPNVVGIAVDFASIQIRSGGFTVAPLTYECSATVPVSAVISQEPAGGAEALPGSAVHLLVSSGPCPIPVPDVVGLTQAAAQAAIVEAGLKVGAVTMQCSLSVPDGLVISQTPSTSARPGSRVNLTVSLGPCYVPDLLGSTLEEAEDTLLGMGLTVGTVTYRHSDTAPEGTVLFQSPDAGVEVDPGSGVNLTISLGSSVAPGDCLQVVLPADGSMVYVPETAPAWYLALVTDSLYPGDIGTVQFSMDGDWVGTTDEAPHILSDFDASALSFGEHFVCADAENVAHPSLACSACAAFALAALPPDSDLDLNGLPDDPFAVLVADGDMWFDFVQVSPTQRDRAVAAVAWVAPEAKMSQTAALALTLKQPENPSQRVIVVAPTALLEPGEMGLLVLETAADLTTLLGTQAAGPLSGHEPGLLVDTGFYVNVDIIVSRDGGLTFAPMDETRLLANPMYLAVQGLDLPNTENVGLHAYPTYIAMNETSGARVALRNGGAWHTLDADAQTVTETSILANLTSLSVLAPYETRVLTAQVSPADSGTIVADPAGPAYPPDSDVNVTAQANEGWRFDHWEGEVLNASTPTTHVRMSGNRTITAVFTRREALTVTVEGEGSVAPAVGVHYYDYGTLVSVAATPASGWEFVRWTGDVFNAEAAHTRVRMDANIEVTAVFAQTVRTVTVSVVGEGEVFPPAGAHRYADGAVVPVVATPAAGWRFDAWQGNVADMQASHTTLTMDADQTLVAVFREANAGDQYLLTLLVSPNDDAMSVVASPAGGLYDAGTVVTLTAQSKPGWQFDHWVGNVTNVNQSTTTITMNGDRQVTAVFKETSSQPWGCFAGNVAAPPSGTFGDGLTLAAVGLLLCGAAARTRRRDRMA